MNKVKDLKNEIENLKMLKEDYSNEFEKIKNYNVTDIEVLKTDLELLKAEFNNLGTIAKVNDFIYIVLYTYIILYCFIMPFINHINYHRIVNY